MSVNFYRLQYTFCGVFLTQKILNFIHIAIILKKGIGIKSQKNYTNKLKIKKVWKEVGDGMEVNVCHKTKVNSTEFPILILTAIVSNIVKADAVRIRIELTLFYDKH